MAATRTNVAVLLDVLESVEAAMAGLYAWLGRTMVIDPEAARFFAEMARDELRHKDLVAFQRQLVAKSRSSFPPIEADAAAMSGVIDRIRRWQHENPGPTLHQALVFVLELENDAAETQYRTALSDADPQMARLITSLAKADEHHAEALHDFARKRGVFSVEG